jgi:glycosyltransferase involved in cell wall biosynthesis
LGRILHVITGLEAGGAEKLLIDFVTVARSRNQDWKIVTLLGEGPFRATATERGIPVVSLDMKRGRPSVYAVFSLARMIRREKPLIVMGWMYHANILTLLALWLSGRRRSTKLCWSIFCTSLIFTNYRWSLPILFRVGAWLSSSVDGLIYNSVKSRDFHIANGYRSRTNSVIQNGIDVAQFCPNVTRRNAMRKQLNIPPDAFVIITVARVDPMKDWASLLSASEGLSGIISILAGTGTEALNGPGRIALGFRPDTADLYNAADAFVLVSSYGEGCSVALTEAMASGLPVITTNVGDNGKVAEGCSIIVKPGDIDALRNAIVRLQLDRETRSRFGQRAREIALEQFSLWCAYARLRGILHEPLAAGASDCRN